MEFKAENIFYDEVIYLLHAKIRVFLTEYFILLQRVFSTSVDVFLFYMN